MLINLKIFQNNILHYFNTNINNQQILKNIIFKKYNIFPQNQIWLYNNKILKYNNLQKGTYYIYENETITLILNINGNLINTPYIPINLKVRELKDIMSINDNIYYNNIKLKETLTLEHYKIKSNNVLHLKPIIHVEY